MSTSKTHGSCDCAAVIYEISTAVHIYACHCRHCQTRSGSAFAEHVLLNARDFDCRGPLVTRTRETDGMTFAEVFCTECLTRVYNRNSALPDAIFLRAGTLAASDTLIPIAHIWTKRKQSWILLPDGVPQFDESPTPEQFGDAIRAAEAARLGQN